MIGLLKATNYYNRLEARIDYLAACKLTEQVPQYGYETLSWRKLDGLVEGLLADTQYAGLDSTGIRKAAESETHTNG